MHLRQRQRRTNEDERPHLAAPRLEVFDTVGKPLPTSFRSGVDVVMVAELLGHASLETTRLYAQPSADDMQRAVDLLAVDG
jgi:integrase